MLWFKNESLESFLKFNLFFLVILICTLYTLLAWKFQLPWHWIAAGEVLVFLTSLWFVTLIRQRVARTFTRACLYTEAMAKGEYEQFKKAAYHKGKVAELYAHLSLLSENLQAHAAEHEQSALFNLLDSLATPVLILNSTSVISYANQAVYDFTQGTDDNDDIEVIQGLNIEAQDDLWQLSSSSTGMQLLTSTLMIKGVQQQLLIFVDTSLSQTAIKEQAWQQLIERIYTLGVNTLAPIASLSEQLKDVHSEVPYITESCDAITQSCESFNNGLVRYLNFSSEAVANPQWILIAELISPHQQYYPSLIINIDPSLSKVWCDVEALQQVLFNLLHNAYEVHAEEVSLSFLQHEQYVVIEIVDDGEGFMNIEQVATPFHTSKANSEGLSLYFAKSVIDSHSGLFECQNNVGKGANVMIALPLSQASCLI